MSQPAHAGARGEGLWQRISRDQSCEEIAARIQQGIDDGHPERVVLHAGRSRINPETQRFLNAHREVSLLFVMAVMHTRVANVVVILSTAPLFVAIFTRLFL